MGHTDTVSPTTLPVGGLPTITCVRLSLSSHTTATRPRPRINTPPQLPALMDSHRRGLLASTGILHNPRGRSMAKALHLPDREDTGVVDHHLLLRVAILELDTVPVGSNTRLDRMASLRPAKADGVAIRRGIDLHQSIRI